MTVLMSIIQSKIVDLYQKYITFDRNKIWLKTIEFLINFNIFDQIWPIFDKN